MSRRRLADVRRDLGEWWQQGLSLALEFVNLTSATTETSAEARGTPVRPRRPPRVVRPAGESDELTSRRAEQIIRRGGLVRP